MRRRLAIAIILMAMAIVATWPLATRLHRSIPKANEASSTVPVLNLWTVGWNLDRAWHGWKGYWDAPHFYPAQRSLALSEPLIVSQSMVVLGWLPPVVAYNVFLLSALVLNGGAMWFALSCRHVRWPVALFVSLAMIRLPFVHSQLGVLQCVLVAGIIGTIHFVDQAIRMRKAKSLWLATICFDLTYFTCGYYGLFLASLLPVTAVVLWWQRANHSGACVGWVKSPRPTSPLTIVGGSHSSTHPTATASMGRKLFSSWIGAIVGTLLILSLLIPVIRVQSQVLSDSTFDRPRELIQELSALPSDYMETWSPEWLQVVGLGRWHEAGRWKLSPGLCKSLLAVVGLVIGIRSRSRRAWTLAWLTVSGTACLGSLGLNLQILGWHPYGTLLDLFPELSRLRTPARMAVFVQIGVLFLAAEALHWGFRHARAAVWHRPHGWPNWRFALVWVGGLAACFEVTLPSPAFVDVPPTQTQSEWTTWLKTQTSPEAVVAYLPFPRGPLAKDYETEAWAMYWGLFHHRRMVNGYSGFFPANYLELKSRMQKFPDEASFEALRSRGVSYCVVRRSFLDERHLEEAQEAKRQWTLMFEDGAAGVAIYELHPSRTPGEASRP